MATKNLYVFTDTLAREVDVFPKENSKVYTIVSQLENLDTKQQHVFPFSITEPVLDCVYECQTNEELMTCALGTKLT